MGVIVSSPPVRPAIAFNRVNVIELRISIPEAQVARAGVRIVYKLFGIDAEGVRHFATEQHVLVVDDAFIAAQTNPALAQALVGIEAGVAALISAEGTHGEATAV